METTTCPECGQVAEVEWRAVLESTDGPVEHARIRCVRKHWYLLPLSSIGDADLSTPQPGVAQTATGRPARHG